MANKETEISQLKGRAEQNQFKSNWPRAVSKSDESIHITLVQRESSKVWELLPQKHTLP